MSFNLFDHAVWISYKATYTLTNSTTKVIETKWNYNKSHIEKNTINSIYLPFVSEFQNNNFFVYKYL